LYLLTLATGFQEDFMSNTSRSLIAGLQRRANADGGVSHREQAMLKRDAAQVRHLIQTAKTN
jgi:hypothetical protein